MDHTAHRGGPLDCRAVVRAAPRAAAGAPPPGTGDHDRPDRLLRPRGRRGVLGCAPAGRRDSQVGRLRAQERTRGLEGAGRDARCLRSAPRPLRSRLRSCAGPGATNAAWPRGWPGRTAAARARGSGPSPTHGPRTAPSSARTARRSGRRRSRRRTTGTARAGCAPSSCLWSARRPASGRKGCQRSAAACPRPPAPPATTPHHHSRADRENKGKSEYSPHENRGLSCRCARAADFRVSALLSLLSSLLLWWMLSPLLSPSYGRSLPWLVGAEGAPHAGSARG